MRFFDFFRRSRAASKTRPSRPATRPPPLPRPEKDPQVATQEAVELLRPHLLSACFGFCREDGREALPTASKVGGEPYAQVGDAWPVDAASGRPMLFVCQVNRSDLPIDLAFPEGLLVVFAHPEDIQNCDLSDAGGPLVVRHYPEPSPSRHARIERPPDEKSPEPLPFRRLEFQVGLSLPDADTVLSMHYERRYSAIGAWSRAMGSVGWHGPFHKAREILLEAQPKGAVVQVGGHPQWVQYAEPPEDERLPHEQFLMQINARGDLGVVWYDHGSVYLYGLPVSLAPDFAVFQCS